MSTITQHAPGTFCWPELATSDQAGARNFYSKLFGWTPDEQDMGGGQTYTMLQKADQAVGALYGLNEEQRNRNIPPHWNAYVSVANADAAAAKAKQLGGTLLMEPFDVMDAGRMATVQDPTGAIVSIWEAKKHIGATVLDEPGSLCWTELITRDTSKAGTFYSSLFGWKRDEMKMPEMTYTVFKRDDKPAGGMMPTLPNMGPNMPSVWLTYFAVEDTDRSADKAKSLGAKVKNGPLDIPNVGRFAVLEDPQGATFAILGPNKS